MNGKRRLCDIKPGQCARVSEISESCTIRRRLRDLGLIRGTIVECVMTGPLGDPAAYIIRGAVIALREDDAKFIIVEVI